MYQKKCAIFLCLKLTAFKSNFLPLCRAFGIGTSTNRTQKHPQQLVFIFLQYLLFLSRNIFLVYFRTALFTVKTVNFYFLSSNADHSIWEDEVLITLFHFYFLLNAPTMMQLFNGEFSLYSFQKRNKKEKAAKVRFRMLPEDYCGALKLVIRTR